MKLNWFYIFIGVLAIGMIFISSRYFRGSAGSSVGVAHAREYKVNAEKPAIIKSILVVAGQQVKKGDLLVELTSSGLQMEIDRVVNKISALKSEQLEKAKLADSQIAYTKAEQGMVVAEMTSEISQAESEQALNRKLSKQYLSSTDSATDERPVDVKLKALKLQRARQEEAVAIKVKDILQQKETEQKLLRDQIVLQEKELAMLENEKRMLSKVASTDGLVVNVYVRQGEQVDAYTPLLSVHPLHPITVIAYMVGKKDELPVGRDVVVRSFDKGGPEVNGKVIGYGAVVELPEILQKSTAVKAFGREVFIEIPPANNFASGEKVLIR